jgi:phospholipid/cholesterol/gamma-HCH transport system ATP-binding protein
VSDQPVVLQFDDVNLAFGDTPALSHLSFQVRAGETRIILGAAGSGKTMLLKCAVGLVRADSGHIFLFGEDVTGMKESQLYDLRGRVGILFQEGGLFDSQTVAENVEYPLDNQAARRRNGARTLAPEEAERRVRDSLRFVELEHTRDKFPSELS